MPNAGNQIGEAYVELRARMDKLEADFARAKAASSQYATQAQSDANATANVTEQASDRVSMGLKKQVSAFTSVIGRVTAAIGVFKLFNDIGARLALTFESGATKAEKFLESIASMDAQSRMNATTKQLAELEAKLTELSQSSYGDQLTYWIRDGETVVGLEKQIAEARKAQMGTAIQLRALDSRKKEQLAGEERAKSAEAQEDIRKLILGHVQDVSDADVEASARARDQRIKDAEAWTEAEKRAVEELRDHEISMAEKVSAARRSIEDDLARRHEEFRKRLWGDASHDIRELARSVKFASLNGRSTGW